MVPSNPVFCAVDTADLSRATGLASELSGVVGGLKLGLEFVYGSGLKAIDAVRKASGGMPLFLDFKFIDIPTTVAAAVTALVPKAPYMLNVHALGGREMMRAAVTAARDGALKQGVPRPLMVAVTVLTSLDQEAVSEVGISGSVTDQVRRLAELSQKCGMDGVVCSPMEARMLRDQCGPDFKLVVPGVRPDWAASNDQKRVLTPAEAMAEGADILVVGRPITGDPSPAGAARRVLQEIESRGRNR
ncbi:MAG: orotidine-5'-phosphate decarboxylase [Alphaproteobacteria bacterium]